MNAEDKKKKEIGRLAIKRCLGYGKENRNPSIKDRLRSSKRVEQMMNAVKSTTTKGITNVKSSIDDISQKFRQNRNLQTLTNFQQYRELNTNVTPVKLYTPFGFVTPSPPKANAFVKKLATERFTFDSPTGRFHKDVKDLSSKIKELETVEKRLLMAVLDDPQRHDP